LIKSLRTLRFQNWWISKIPPLLSYVFMIMIIQKQVLFDMWYVLILLVVWMIGAAAFGHYINDVFDLTDDLKAGKENKTQNHNAYQRWGISIGLGILTLAPWLLLPKNQLNLSLVLAQMVIFLMYSAPPIRLKVRGIAAVLADAVYAHVIPGMVVVTTAWQLNGEFPMDLLVLFAVWQLFIGVRNILNHHIDDYENDKVSGTRTTATVHGTKKIKRVIKILLIPIEITLLMVIFYKLGNPFRYGLIFYAIYIVYTFNREVTYLRENMGEYKGPGRYDYLSGILLNEFYEKWIPIILLIILGTADPLIWGLLALHLGLFWPVTKSFVRDYHHMTGALYLIAKKIYFLIEGMIRHLHYSKIKTWGNQIKWAFFKVRHRVYWWSQKFYYRHIKRLGWVIVKGYYRVEYFFWKTFYKPVKDLFKSGK